MVIDRGEEPEIYRTAVQAAKGCLERSKQWPKAERYALIDLIRQSSRAVCANTSKAWRKQRYSKHFVSMRSDADAEAAETRTGLRFVHSCAYLDEESFRALDEQYDQIYGGLVRRMSNPETGSGSADTAQEPSILYDTE